MPRGSVTSAGFSSAASVHPPGTGGGGGIAELAKSPESPTHGLHICCGAGQGGAAPTPPVPEEGDWHVYTVYTTCSQAKTRMRDEKEDSRHRKTKPLGRFRLFPSLNKQLLVPHKDRLERQTQLPVAERSLA